MNVMYYSKRFCGWIGLITLCLILAVFGKANLAEAGKTTLQPDKLNPPKVRLDNKGSYMCPFTQDGVIAEWVDKAINAKIGSKVGEQGGGLLGQKLSGKSSFLGGALGGALGNKAGHKVAIKTCGGWEGIKKASDISFDSIEDMAVYMHQKHSAHPQYAEVLDAAMTIYPELKKNYDQSLAKATKK